MRALLLALLVATPLAAQPRGAVPTGATVHPTVPAPPPATDPRLYDIVAAPSPARIEADIRTLVGFGTRNTLSDTLSRTRGIGAARRWVKAEFDRIARECGGCLDVRYVSSVDTVRGGRVANVVSVIAIQRGTTHPGRYVLMSGDLDARASNTLDDTTDTPGANDNASGVAGTLEAARVLTKHRFGASIVYAALAGEEQGLWGGRAVAALAKREGWDLAAVLNNDMIGNIAGIDGVIDNTTFRVFSEPTAVADSGTGRWSTRVYGGEVDGPSRQLARYIARITDTYFTNLDAMLIYRLDRFGRGGHHRPFNDLGYPGVRIMETHEHYDRQHQNVRVENGRRFGDVIDGVNFPYAAKLTAVNASVLAALAWAPPAPTNVRIGGAVSASTTLAWDGVPSPDLAGYRIYWRATTAPQWTHSRWVGPVTQYTLENVVIDNYLFGVAAVGKDGNESPVVFPSGLMRR
jgi:Zn-dependent M28 family amino/carboxypeptidase